MPTDSSWVEPETLLSYEGVDVYHTYRHDDIAQGKRSYWYTLSERCGEGTCEDERCGDECRMVFDIRELPSWEQLEHMGQTHNKVIMKAIEEGHLTKDGVRVKEETSDRP